MNKLESYAESNVDSNELVTGYVQLVKRIAYHMVGRLPQSVQPDDLIQAGMIGLIEASRNFNPSLGASFETYAGIRIRGAMIDEVRRNDWAPRSVHRKSRELTEAIRKVEERMGRDANDTEIADELGLPMAEYNDLLCHISGHRLVSFDTAGNEQEGLSEVVCDQSADPVYELESKNLQKTIAASISDLPERERMVLALYYQEELNLREIGEVIGVSESRVCQIHGQALARLQSKLAV